MNLWKSINRIAACLTLGSLMASCSLIEDDLPECGLDLYFRYDYNLERANMFADHIGGLRAYVYDENGKFLTSQTDMRTAADNPFKKDGYHMHFALPKGKYRVVAVAYQTDYAATLATPGAKQRYTEPQVGDDITALRFDLDHSATADADGRYAVENASAPLDTLWYGMSGNELTAKSYVAVPQAQVIDLNGDKASSRDTISLVRDTKQINITLRDVERPEEMDVNNFDFRILDRNSAILWNNAVDESKNLLYTPYHTWNTEDRTATTSAASILADAAATTGIGRIAHADFMTSRILYHDNAADDAVLSVTNRNTQQEVIRVDLADLLSRLRTSADIYRYTPQQFLDRGYDYRLSFFLQGDRWLYVNIEISVLGWSVRYQREQL